MILILCAALLTTVSTARPAAAQARAQNQVMQSYITQGKTLTQLRQDLDSKSTMLVRAIGDSLELDDQQSKKLLLACRGDVSRFFEELTEVELHTQHIDLQQMAGNQDEWQKIWPLVMPPRQRLENGLHTKNSLFQKTLGAILTADQQERYQLLQREKTQRMVMALAKLTLIEFEKKVPLSKSQRDRIIELLESSRKPKSINTNMEAYVGIVMLSKLPKAELIDILTEEQFDIFQQAFKNADRYNGVEW